LRRGIESLWRVEGGGGSTTARSGGFKDGMDRREQKKLAAYPKTPHHNTATLSQSSSNFNFITSSSSPKCC